MGQGAVATSAPSRFLDDRPADAIGTPGPHSSDIAGRAAPGRRRALRRVGLHLVVIAGFAVPAVALFWHAWSGHPSSTLTCACGDAGQTVWFVAWPAYAIAHGLDPFFSGALEAPYGVNLLSNASAVPVGVLLAPVTWAAGPVAATNVALTLCPALSAWGLWLACRRLVSWRPAAVVAALLFGYSPFVVTNVALGHVGVSLLVAPPLLLLATRQLLFGPAERRTRWAVGIGALLALQYLLSSEILAIVVVVGVPCALVAAVVGHRCLPPPRDLLRAVGVAGLVAAMLLAFPVWFFLAGAQHLRGPLWQGASIQGNTLVALWDPGHYGSSTGTLLHFGGYEGHIGPPSSYLGPVVLALAAVAFVSAWRRRTAWLLVAGTLVAVASSFGILLWIRPGDAQNVWLPWRVLGTWPLLDDVIPQRFSAVTDLCVALLIGVGIDAVVRRVRLRRRAGTWRTVTASCCIVASGAAVVSLWWTYQVPFVTRTVSPPAWYETAAPRLAPGTVVLSYPFPFPLDGSSAAMVWQAVDGMRFELAGGYVKAPAADGRPLADLPPPEANGVLARLTARAPGRLPVADTRTVGALREAIAHWRVDEVVVATRGRDPALARRLFTRAIGRPPERELGVWVWRLGPRR
jgi:hypothetical protein